MTADELQIVEIFSLLSQRIEMICKSNYINLIFYYYLSLGYPELFHNHTAESFYDTASRHKFVLAIFVTNYRTFDMEYLGLSGIMVG